MKLLAGFLTLALSLGVMADSGETKTFTYDGSQSSVELLLRGEKTHTEYRYENRQTICTRTEIAGYRTICTGGTRGPGPRPAPGPRHCTRHPIYRTVSYPCTQTVRIPYEVKDYDVDARVLIDVTNLTGVATAGEKFTVSLKGEDLKISVNGSKKFILVAKEKSTTANTVGSVKYIDSFLAVNLVEAAPVLNTLKMTKITMKPTLTFDFGALANGAKFNYGVKIVREKTLGSDPVIFNRDLTADEYSVTATNTATSVQADLERMGVNLASGKYSITGRVSFDAEGEVLNASQFDLTGTRTLSYKK